ncbi:MAG: tyrosine-protein phosphatase [Lentisphaeria bacterium]|nr:tyrosine-protein phosphatase [Lentisphaeria bacterium]
MKKSLFVLLGLSGILCGDIILKEIPSPVVLLQPEQKKIMQYDTHEERAAIMKEDHKLPKEKRTYCSNTAKWREALPVTFAWECTDGEIGPFTVTFADNEAFENPQYAYSKKDNDTSVTPPNYMTNFKIGQKYYWKVTGKSKDKKEMTSAMSSFTTEDMAPRWIKLEGRVGNTRDLGGWKTMDGRRIKQNMIFRGQGLNDNSSNGKQPGRNRLTAADIDWMLNTLHIKTDLDLRSSGETANMTVSPLGPTVQFIHHSSSCYRGIFKEKYMKVMAENFRVFTDPDNYPIYFHCIGGADRCGSLSLVLEAILGVPERELGIDWENTFYPHLPDMKDEFGPNYWCRYQDFLEWFPKYGKEGDSFNKCVENYLLQCGITMEEIEKFRKIMLE